MRQRLVGALVLLSAGVVLWSILFTGPAAYRVDRQTQIPPMPAVQQPEPIEPRRPENIPEVAEPEPLPEPPVPDLSSKNAESEDAKAKAADEKATTVDVHTGEANAWVIQVASFSSVANAENLQKRLREKGYKAYVRSVPGSSGKPLQRVFVGPELRREVALEQKSEIEAAFKLKALLHNYEP